MINELMKMPTVGPKTAQRLAFHIVKASADDAERLIRAIKDVKEKIRQCRICFNLTDEDVCAICKNESRSGETICVVSDARDIPVIEKSRAFSGKYHVLGGLISPLDGIGPDHLNIKSLLSRISKGGVNEIIIAIGSDTAGEVTSMYLARILAPLGLKVYRLAYGLPMGASLEHADEITLSRAFEGKRPI